MGSDPNQIGSEFVSDMEACWGHDLESVVLYGSGARDDFVPGKSDLNFLVIVRGLAPERLMTLQARSKAWRKKKIAMPVFMRPEMVATALDSYPLEFLAMQGSYRVLHGGDPLAGLSIERRDVRLQCERELRGKLLHLRAGAIAGAGKAGEMAELIRVSLPAMTAVFQGVLYLGGRAHALWGDELIDAGADAFGLDAPLFHELNGLRRAKRPPAKEVMKDLLARYLREVERLVDMVDAGGLRTGAPAGPQV